MLKNTKLNRIAMAVALSVGMSTAAMAQETSSSLKGVITGPQGNPAPGTVVTITHVPSGSVKTAVVGASGQFSAKGLRVGGPYSVKFDSDKFADTTVNDVYLNLGEPLDLSLALEQMQDIESIVVTASSVSTSVFGETGPATNFSLSDLENAPAINRDINDVIRADPRVYIDESFNNAVQCAGASPRFNSLTLDGVRMNDNFGLNSNGYPTEAMPFSYDAIEQVAVELAPFDVQYGGFTACNINAVTKSGTNEIHGGLFYDYSSDSLKGDTADGEFQDNGDYTDKRYGFHVGFPILKDTLFFFGAYEKAESAELFEYDIGGRISQADIDRAIQIARDSYGYDAGGTPGSMPVEDEKLLLKLDWNINDDHRASLMYNWNDGFSLSQSDSGSGRTSLSNHFYERGAEIKSTVLSVYSDWTDDFTTELRIGKTDLDNRQTSIDAASGFAEVQIRTDGGGTIYIGPDDSRQSNDLNWDNFTMKLAGTYYADEHTITAGIEYEKLNVFNLFMQHTVGEYRFSSLDDFEAGTPSRIYYNNSAGTNNPADAGASFTTKMWTAYVQDDFYLTDDIQMMVGLRYDRWSTSDEPTFNQQFQDRYGFSNTGTVDGMDLLQPRVGFNWSLEDNLELRGGFGLYSGGNPNVWISNAYSNDGVTNIGLQDRSGESLFNKVLTGAGRPIYDIPQALFDAVAATSPSDGDGSVNATDPDFDVPSEWKFNIGATYVTEDDWVILADILYTDKQNSAIVYDLSVERTGATAPDGRPIYDSVDGRFSGSDHLLTNVSGGDGSSKVFSLAANKSFDNGLDVSAAYAFTRATDVNPMTSAVAFSNAGNVAVADQRNYGAATSDYEIRHRITLNLGYSHEFFDGYATRFNLFGNISEGKPVSFVYSDSGDMWEDQSDYRSLIYVPLLDDPNVVWADGEAAFNDLVEAEGLTRGEIMTRNSTSADWWVKFDLRVEQELPGFMDGHKASAFFVVKNLGNLINDEWGIMRQGSFVGDDIIEASINDQGQYVYSYNGYDQTIQRDASLWEVRLGVKYKF
ncbi:TonB-dependent receptor [Aestuariibacter halophilus]|uniref:TonB-dependent receptor n=1 Tax=Fluctibacter halophilus TaxID=226011 RepID=A0ABS8G721_9ALTE|nr:TonB-dependent receptor [Aestuariibacter halophilus]MCC2616392.1 TonB-dependent receptor [Aestuariibacter halophilus]